MAATSQMSLKKKLMCMSIGLTGMLGLTSAVGAYHISKMQEESRFKSFGSEAAALTGSIMTQFYERYGDVQSFAMNGDLLSSDKSIIVRDLNHYVLLYGIYDLLMLVDLKGHLVAVNSRAADGREIRSELLAQQSYAEAEWFKAVVGGRTSDDLANKLTGTYVEDVQIDPYTSAVLAQKTYGNGFSAPLYDAHGVMVGVLSARANNRWFTAAFEDAFTQMKARGWVSTQFSLLSRDHVPMYVFPEATPEHAMAEQVIS